MSLLVDDSFVTEQIVHSVRSFVPLFIICVLLFVLDFYTDLVLFSSKLTINYNG